MRHRHVDFLISVAVWFVLAHLVKPFISQVLLCNMASFVPAAAKATPRLLFVPLARSNTLTRSCIVLRCTSCAFLALLSVFEARLIMCGSSWQPMQELFEDLISHDHYDLDGMDTYSNILYMKENFAKLSHLAHKAVMVDKYRPETCCVIGNYYSLKTLHDKV